MEYTRDTQCERCHLWYHGTDLTRVGEGDGLVLCARCIETLWPDDEYASRITHEGQFEDETPAWAILPDENDSLALAVRTTAGLRVEVVEGFVVVTQNGESVTADVADADLFDAFHHPALYISPEQCEKIGLR